MYILSDEEFMNVNFLYLPDIFRTSTLEKFPLASAFVSESVNLLAVEQSCGY